MLSMLIGYNEEGDVVATLDYMVARDEYDQVMGLIDFEAHELAGGEMTDVIVMGEPVVGAKVWPEWLGPGVYDFKVERAGPAGRKRAVALVHKRSGLRRERAVIEAAIAERIEETRDRARRLDLSAADAEDAMLARVTDIRDIVGGPENPLELDADGRTVPRKPRERTRLPILQVLREHLHDPELVEAIEGGGRAAGDDQP